MENRTGAGGTVGMDTAMKSPPDGYTVLITNDNAASAPHIMKLPYDYTKELDAGDLSWRASRQVLCAHPVAQREYDGGADRLREGQPGRWATPPRASASNQHILGEWFKTRDRAQARPRPYRGAGQAINDLVAGHVKFAWLGPTATVPQYKAGKLRMLANSSAKRAPYISEIPTLEEAGFKGVVLEAWYAAPEILEELDEVTAFVAGLGTGGTLMGNGRRLREELGDAVKIVAAEPMQGEPVQGLRSLDDGFIPPIIDLSLLDRKIFVTNHDAIVWTRRLLDEEGIFAGVSSGAIASIAVRIANELDEGNIVFIVCDDGWKYLSSGHLHAPGRGDREPGLHRLVVSPPVPAPPACRAARCSRRAPWRGRRAARRLRGRRRCAGAPPTPRCWPACWRASSAAIAALGARAASGAARRRARAAARRCAQDRRHASAWPRAAARGRRAAPRPPRRSGRPRSAPQAGGRVRLRRRAARARATAPARRSVMQIARRRGRARRRAAARAGEEPRARRLRRLHGAA